MRRKGHCVYQQRYDYGVTGMEKAFRASLCYHGLRGGAVYIENGAVVYKNQTATMPEAYKNIVMPVQEITAVEKGRKLIFPTVTLRLAGGASYCFVVFARERFLAMLGTMDVAERR